MSIEELEILRKQARNRVLIGTLISVVVALGLFLMTHLMPVLFTGIFVGIILTIIISSKATKKFTFVFKEFFVEKALKEVFTDLIYMPENGLDESIISNTGMMDMGDRYSSNDYISAKYKDINVLQADVHIEEKQETVDSDGHTSEHWVTIFRGKWIVFDFNKNFKANVQLCQKGFENSIVNNWNSKIKYKKVMMEDQAFNKQFKLYAQNEHDAFYILTPSLMEKIKNLVNSINGKLLFCFVDNKLHVGLHNGKDSFEPSIFTKINEAKVLETISNDIKLITNFVDKLNLDNDLFRKEV